MPNKYQVALDNAPEVYAGVFDDKGKWTKTFKNFTEAKSAYDAGEEVTVIGKVGLYHFDGQSDPS